MSLTLYTARFDSVPVIGCSPPSWAVWIACLEKGVEFEHHQLDFEKQEHKSPDFLAINPKGTLPALFDRERLVSETRAMLDCVERQNGPKLLGETRELRSRGMQRLKLADDLKSAGMIWLSSRMKGTDSEAERAAYLVEVEKVASAFDGGPFLASPDEEGTRPGLADMLAFAYLTTTARLGVELDLAAVTRFFEAMNERPSVRTTRPA